jgi:hypothetical protein
LRVIVFKSAPAAVPVPQPVEAAQNELVPLSVLVLELDLQPAGGWRAYLEGRGIAVVTDGIGRLALSCDDARLLVGEQRAAEARRQEALARNEQRTIEAYERWRGQLWQELSAAALPEGVSAGDAMAQAARDGLPKRRSPLEEALSNSPEMTYHAWPSEEDVA